MDVSQDNDESSHDDDESIGNNQSDGNKVMGTHFLWKSQDQDMYHDILVNKYIKALFEHIKNKGYVFYLDRNNDQVYEKTVEYYKTGKPIDVTQFHVSGHKFRHFSEFPINPENDTYDVDPINIPLTITDVSEETEEGECGQCHKAYGGGFWFTGNAYNVGFETSYEGRINTYYLNKCMCSLKTLDWPDEIECTRYDDLPFVVIDCSIPDQNLKLYRQCILFNINYTDDTFATPPSHTPPHTPSHTIKD